VEISVLSMEELRAILAREVERQLPKDKLEGQLLAMQLLGLVPPGYDLQGGFQDLLTEQIGGLYDEETDRLYIMEWINLRTQLARGILAHEITHALQDQHFDLSQSPIRSLDNDDAATAALAVIEGDAMLAMADHMAIHGGFGVMFEMAQMVGMDQSALSRTPPFLQTQLVFPYLTGQTFMARARLERHGSLAGNHLLRHWPESTEQLLHPERSSAIGDSIDHPTPVALDATAWGVPANWTRLESNVWGELATRGIFRDSAGVRAASRIAEGWDGDLWEIWWNEESGGVAYLWSTVWDTVEDADAFRRAIPRVWSRVTLSSVVDLSGREVFAAPHINVNQNAATVNVAVWNESGGVIITPPSISIIRRD
jgi:hypothetical protein